MVFWLLLSGSAASLAAPAPRPTPTSVAPAAVAPPSTLERAVVNLVNTRQRADPSTPWNPGPPGRSSGSGFVIDGKRIVTNAHVVADSRMLVVYLQGDATPHEARIVAVGHDCDLAVVELVDAKLLDGITPLTFGPMPARGDEVVTYGYPAGGRWMSSTRGVVSRFDVQSYTHPGNATHLVVQTDAAINPGNSGGPVVRDGKVVGVAFQGAGGLENTGFFIPNTVVDHFLADVSDGDGYQGFPSLDVVFSNMESAAARRRAGMGEDETGVRVEFVHPATPAKGTIRAGDIVLALDGQVVANDGTVAYGDQRLQASFLVDRYRVGQSVPARVLRDGQRVEVAVPVAPTVVPGKVYDSRRKYLVYAGLVFVELDAEYLSTIRPGPVELMESILGQLESPDVVKPKRVVLLRRLDHEVNTSLPVSRNEVVDQVNGVSVHSLAELASALDNNQGRHHVFSFAWSPEIAVLDRAKADAAHEQILQRYAVTDARRL